MSTLIKAALGKAGWLIRPIEVDITFIHLHDENYTCIGEVEDIIVEEDG